MNKHYCSLSIVCSLVGHIYLKKKAWRAMIMESKQRAELLVNATNQTLGLLSENASISFDLISLYLRHEFKQIYDSAMTKGDTAWYMDQILCSMLITDYREGHKGFRVAERGRAGRLDRADPISRWNSDNFDQYGDAHLIHDAILLERNWKIFNKLLNYLFTPNLVQVFNDYYQQYLIADKVFPTPKTNTGGK